MSLKTELSYEEKYRRELILDSECQKVRNKNARRNSNGLTTREQSKVNRIILILSLQEVGYTQSEISRKLGITRQAVSKLVKEINEKNLSLDLLNEIIEIKKEDYKLVIKELNKIKRIVRILALKKVGYNEEEILKRLKININELKEIEKNNFDLDDIHSSIFGKLI